MVTFSLTYEHTPILDWLDFFFPKQMIKQYYSTYAHWIISIMSMACMHMKLDNFHYKHGMHAYEIQRRGHIFWFKIILKFSY